MIRVVICDDHALVRKGLAMILAQAGDVAVAGEASNYGELRQLLRKVECDVLLVDVEMPGRDGIEAVGLLKKELPRVAALVLSGHPEARFAVRALRAGALGYLNKANAPEILIDAVRHAAMGRKYLSPEVSQALAEAVSTDPADEPHRELSQREFQVFRMIAGGKRLSEIAAALSLSPKTVSVYRARVLEKLGVENNVEIARYAVRHGVVDAGED